MAQNLALKMLARSLALALALSCSKLRSLANILQREITREYALGNKVWGRHALDLFRGCDVRRHTHDLC